MIGHSDKQTSWGSGVAPGVARVPEVQSQPDAAANPAGDLEAAADAGRAGSGFFAEFNVEALLAATTKERYEAYDLALKSKWQVINDVRRQRKPGASPLGRSSVGPAAGRAARRSRQRTADNADQGGME
jgi:hypothetical protein